MSTKRTAAGRGTIKPDAESSSKRIRTKSPPASPRVSNDGRFDDQPQSSQARPPPSPEPAPEQMEIDAPPAEAPPRPPPETNAPAAKAPNRNADVELKILGKPYSVLPLTFILVNTEGMIPFFTSIYTVILNDLWPGNALVPAGTVTEAQFVNVCRYLTKARVDTVYSKVSGQRSANRIPIPSDMAIPKCLSDVLNGIGLITALNGDLRLVPQPETDPPDQNARLGNVVTHAVLASFNQLITIATNSGSIRTGTIVHTTEGTAWWTLRVVNCITQAIANGANLVQILSTTKDFTPRDVTMAAIVQRQNDGLVPNYLVGVNWSSEPLSGILSTRRSFITNA